MRTRRRGAAAAIVAASLALVASGCSSSGSSAKGSTGAAAASGDKSSTVKIKLTSQGCQPKPATIPAGAVEFDVTNSDAGSVTEAELRTNDKAHILGEQENLTPGLSGGFSLTIQPGTYTVNCPGASQPDWTFTVTGKATGPSWQSNPQLVTAMQGYAGYVKQNTADLVSHTQTLCQTINAQAGTLLGGLFFIAFMQNPAQFIQLQRSLAGDALNEYIHHTGSAVFAVPPGLRPSQHYGDALFA
jgi:iron uptake system component EfeO